MNVGLLFMGVVFAVVGGLVLRQEIRFQRTGVRVMGTVTGIKEEWMSSGHHSHRTYKTVVRFSTQDGKEIETTTMVGMPSPGHRVGEVVPVIYDPADPTRAGINTLGRRSVAPVVGLVFLPLGVVLLVVGITA